jgi:hypothetical protein
MGLATVKLAGDCHHFAPSAEEDVLVAGTMCASGDVSLAVVEFNFRSRDLSRVEPRFLTESLMQGSEGLQSGALDSYSPASSTLGSAGDFTGRAVVDGAPVQTLGRIVTTGNKGVMVLIAGPDRGKLTDAFKTMVDSLAPATPPAG